MSFWKSILGRTEAATAQLDSLFMVPSAAITLQTAAGFTPTGVGSVCYREAEGAPFEQIQAQLASIEEDFQPAGSIGPEIELVFNGAPDPFHEEFDEEEVVGELCRFAKEARRLPELVVATNLSWRDRLRRSVYFSRLMLGRR